MKQWFKNAKMLLLLPLAFLMVNCSKDKGNNNNYANNYYMANGMCWSRANGQQVNQSYCNGLTTSQYYLSNGQCIDSRTGQYVQYQLCQQQPMPGGYGQVCVGYYTYPVNGTSGYCQQPDYTGRNNCSGYTMVNQYGQQVYCQ